MRVRIVIEKGDDFTRRVSQSEVARVRQIPSAGLVAQVEHTREVGHDSSRVMIWGGIHNDDLLGSRILLGEACEVLADALRSVVGRNDDSESHLCIPRR